MKKNVIKVFAVLLAAILCITMFASIANGMSLNDAKNANQYDNASDDSNTAERIQKVMGSALVVVQVVGMGVAVIMLVVLAIKYISAAPGDKAEIKKHAVVYVVGAVVLFAASGLLGIIRHFADIFNE